MVRLTDCPDMTLDVYPGCKTTTQQLSFKHLDHSRYFVDVPAILFAVKHTVMTKSNKKTENALIFNIPVSEYALIDKFNELCKPLYVLYVD